MPTSVIIGRILLAADQQLGVEKGTVITSTDLVDRGGVQVNEDGSRDVFTAASLGEDGVQLAGIVQRLCLWIRTTILLQAVLEKVPVEGRQLAQRTERPATRRSEHTIPMLSYQAEYQPGRYGDGESA